MNRVEGWWNWLHKPQPRVEDATYEKLFSGDYPDQESYPELIRRMKPIVRAMACRDNRNEAEDMTNSVFLEFAQQFPGTPPEEGLLRLAQAIRKVIGSNAFYDGGQPVVFYSQLALYHVTDPELRRCLQEQIHRGLNRLQDKSLAEELASVLGISPDRVAETSRTAWRDLSRVMNKDWNKNELGALSEGYLPWQSPTEEPL